MMESRFRGAGFQTPGTRTVAGITNLKKGRRDIMAKYLTETDLMAEMEAQAEARKPLLAAEYMASVEAFKVKHSQIKNWEELTEAEAEELDRICSYEREFIFGERNRNNPLWVKQYETHKMFVEWCKRLGYLPWGSVPKSNNLRGSRADGKGGQ
jgi:hypothetical protein